MKNRALALMALLCCFAAPEVRAAQTTLKLMTEDYPPFNMVDANGQIVGLGTDVVREVMRRAHIPYTIQLQPWIRSFNLSVMENNTCVYSTTRTENREHQFKWVGPILENPWVLYAGPKSPQGIYNIEDVRRYKIGGYSGDAVAQYLIARGFEVELTPFDQLNAKKLAVGRIDFWATGKYLGSYLIQREKLSDLKPILVFNTAFMYLACNPGIPDQTILKLNNLLVGMHQDGFIDRTIRHYLP